MASKKKTKGKGTQSGLPQAGKASPKMKDAKPLLSDIVHRATGELPQILPMDGVDPKIQELGDRFDRLIGDAIAILGPEGAPKFLLAGMAAAFARDELIETANQAMSEVAELFGEMLEPQLKVYRLRIKLENAPVKIERVVDVPDCSLDYLHYVIQDIFEWEDYHLHVFMDGKEQFGPIPENDGLMEIEWEDESAVLLSMLIGGAKKKKLLYEYDFGDGWRHQIELVSTTEVAKRPACAVCIEGVGAGPPEDVGGVWGYAKMLERLKSGELDEEEDFLDADYDPNHFDLKKKNSLLKKLKWDDFHRPTSME